MKLFIDENITDISRLSEQDSLKCLQSKILNRVNNFHKKTMFDYIRLPRLVFSPMNFDVYEGFVGGSLWS